MPDIKLFKNTLFTKDGYAQPVFYTMDGENKFFEAMETSSGVPAVQLSSVNNYAFAEGTNYILVTLPKTSANTLYNYARIEMQNGNVKYYWVDRIEYVEQPKQSEEDYMYRFWLSSDDWVNAMVRIQNIDVGEYEYEQPSARNFYLERTNKKTIINSLLAENDLPVFHDENNYQDTAIFSNKCRIILICTITSPNSGLPYGSFIILALPNEFTYGGGAPIKEIIKETLIVNNGGTILNANYPPEYNKDVISWANFNVSKCLVLPSELIPSAFFYQYDLYYANAQFKIENATYTKKLQVCAMHVESKRNIINNKALSMAGINGALLNTEIGTLTTRVRFCKYIKDPPVPAPNLKYKNPLPLRAPLGLTSEQGVNIVLRIDGEAVSISLEGADGATDITDSFIFNQAYSDAALKQKQLQNQAQTQQLLSILSLIVSVGGTIASGGATLPLVLGTAGGIAQAFNQQQQINRLGETYKISSVTGGAGAYTNLNYLVTGRIYGAVTGQKDIYLKQKTFYTYYGARVNTSLDFNSIIAVPPTTEEQFFVIKGNGDFAGIPTDYAEYLQKRFNNGVMIVSYDWAGA